VQDFGLGLLRLKGHVFEFEVVHLAGRTQRVGGF